MKKLIAICLIGWLIKHVAVFPCVDWVEHEVTGFEVRLKWNF